MEHSRAREAVERLLARFGEDTTAAGGADRRPVVVPTTAEAETTKYVVKGGSGVYGRPRLLFCGVVSGPLAYDLGLPGEIVSSPVHPFVSLFATKFNLTCHSCQVDLYAICVVPTESLLGIAAIDVNLKEWTLACVQVCLNGRVNKAQLADWGLSFAEMCRMVTLFGWMRSPSLLISCYMVLHSWLECLG